MSAEYPCPHCEQTRKSKTEVSMLRSMPHFPWLHSHKPSIWPPCGTVLIWVWIKQLRECNLTPLVAANMSNHQPTCAITNSEHFVVVVQNQSFALLLCFSLCGKHGRYSSGFLRRILSVMFWLVEAAWATWQPQTVDWTCKPHRGS